jgi:hypothetical protein
VNREEDFRRKLKAEDDDAIVAFLLWVLEIAEQKKKLH